MNLRVAIQLCIYITMRNNFSSNTTNCVCVCVIGRWRSEVNFDFGILRNAPLGQALLIKVNVNLTWFCFTEFYSSLWCEGDSSSPPSSDMKRTCNCTSIAKLSSWRAEEPACLSPVHVTNNYNDFNYIKCYVLIRPQLNFTNLF